jgi:hypothetical protein
MDATAKQQLETKLRLANELERKICNLKEACEGFKNCDAFTVQFVPTFELHAQRSGENRTRRVCFQDQLAGLTPRVHAAIAEILGQELSTAEGEYASL